VFRTVDGALELIEIAPGIDLGKDVLQQMASGRGSPLTSSVWTSACSCRQ